MLIYFGSRERTVDDWKYLLDKVDGRFIIEGFNAASGQTNVIISVRWDVASKDEGHHHISISDAVLPNGTPEGER